MNAHSIRTRILGDGNHWTLSKYGPNAGTNANRLRPLHLQIRRHHERYPSVPTMKRILSFELGLAPQEVVKSNAGKSVISASRVVSEALTR